MKIRYLSPGETIDEPMGFWPRTYITKKEALEMFPPLQSNPGLKSNQQQLEEMSFLSDDVAFKQTPCITNDAWIVNLKFNKTKGSKMKMDSESKKYMLDVLDARKARCEGEIEQMTKLMALYGEKLSKALTELDKIKNSILDLQNVESDAQGCGDCCDGIGEC